MFFDDVIVTIRNPATPTDRSVTGCRSRRPVLADAQTSDRKSRAFQIVGPLEAEAVHKTLAAGAYFQTHGAAWWNGLIDDGADRSVQRAQEKFEVRTALNL